MHNIKKTYDMQLHKFCNLLLSSDIKSKQSLVLPVIATILPSVSKLINKIIMKTRTIFFFYALLIVVFIVAFWTKTAFNAATTANKVLIICSPIELPQLFFYKSSVKYQNQF